MAFGNTVTDPAPTLLATVSGTAFNFATSACALDADPRDGELLDPPEVVATTNAMTTTTTMPITIHGTLLCRCARARTRAVDATLGLAAGFVTGLVVGLRERCC